MTSRALPLCPALLLLAGCAATQAQRQVACSPLPPPPPRAVVFCADGAGGFGSTTRALRQAAAEDRAPLHVEALDWSHGYGRVLADQTDHCHALAEARRLAGMVARQRASRPDLPVSLVGHSAGALVVLEAAACLPAGSVERIVLLAPAVSADYDLRPALACARQGVDVFYSGRDLGALGVGVAIVGTTDRRWTAAAGRVGFRPAEGADVGQYQKLRQCAWTEDMGLTGHDGRHYGAHRPGFVRAYLLPLLVPH